MAGKRRGAFVLLAVGVVVAFVGLFFPWREPVYAGLKPVYRYQGGMNGHEYSANVPLSHGYEADGFAQTAGLVPWLLAVYLLAALAALRRAPVSPRLAILGLIGLAYLLANATGGAGATPGRIGYGVGMGLMLGGWLAGWGRLVRKARARPASSGS